jgi:hypothetical protein
MAAATNALGIRSPRTRRSPTVRFFFVALSVVFVGVATLGFGPNQLDHIAGKLAISAVGQSHGVLMVTWLLTFATQAVFAAKGRLDLHRRLGAFGIGLGVAVWLSLVGLTIRELINPHVPLEKRIDNSLPQLYVVLVFLPLFVMAVRLRTNPPWHKRFLAIATIALLQAAVDRFRWLPDMATGYWPQVVVLDVLLTLLVIFDLISLRRIHPATIVGGSVLFAGQCVVAVLWGAGWWPPATVWLAQTIRHLF